MFPLDYLVIVLKQVNLLVLLEVLALKGQTPYIIDLRASLPLRLVSFA